MAVLQQDILIKGNSVDATAVPGSLKEREIAGNMLDRSLFGSDGTSVFRFYEHSEKYFNEYGFANNALKLGGFLPTYFQKALESGVNIKTINGESILGSGDISTYWTYDEINDTLMCDKFVIYSEQILGNVIGVSSSTDPMNSSIAVLGADVNSISFYANGADGSLWGGFSMQADNCTFIGQSYAMYFFESGWTLGDMEGNLLFTVTSDLISINNPTSYPIIEFKKSNSILGYIGFIENYCIVKFGNSSTAYGIIHEGNISEYLPTTLPASDVYAWAKASTKPTYAFSEITDKPTTLEGYGITNALSTAGGTISGQLNATNINGYTPITSGNIGSQSVYSADYCGKIKTVASLHSDNTTFDLNTLTDGGMVYNYYNTSSWINGPMTFSYGQVWNIKGAYDALSAQLAWDVNHASTVDTTRSLWWRASDNGLFVNAQWHQIAFTNSNVASATKLQNIRYIWGQAFDGSANVSGVLKTPSGWTAVSIFDDYLVLGQGLAANGKSSYLDGNAVYLRYGKSGTIGLTLNSSGNALIGTTTDNGNKLQVDGNISATGNITAAGNITAGAASDRRLKTDITSIAHTDAIGVLMTLNPVSFAWNGIATSKDNNLVGKSVGFLADEYENIINNSGRDIWGEYRAIDYKLAIPYLVTGWQNHETRLEMLERENNELKLEINMLKSIINGID